MRRTQPITTNAHALVKQPPARLICTICQEVFDNPVHGLPCCHCFCEKCILEWTEESSTCPICREDLYEDVFGSCVLKKAIVVSEFLEELEVRCKFGVQCNVPCHSFGVIGNEFAALPDGCNVTMPLKNIQSHEEKCPYGKTTRNIDILRENEELKEKVHNLTRKIGSMAVALQRASAEYDELREMYEDEKVIPFDSYRYSIGDALIFARLLSHHMFDGSAIDKNRCYTSLQRIALEWEKQKYCYDVEEREQVHFLFYTATMCNFWTPKQMGKLLEWREQFDPKN